jgi:hypothetical protein
LQKDPAALLGERGVVLIDANFPDREGIFWGCPTMLGDVFNIIANTCQIGSAYARDENSRIL